MASLRQKQQHNEELGALFTEYAQACLEKQNNYLHQALSRRQIPVQKIQSLEEAYQIYITPGRNIPLKPIKRYLIQQIEAAASFLRDFQIGVLGQRTSIFQLHEIEFQIDDCFRQAYQFESGKLLLKIPYWQISSLSRYLNEQKLKQIWHQGVHFPKRSPVRKYWWLMNPIGDFRSNLRNLLILAAQKQILGLDQLLTKLNLIEGQQTTTIAPQTALPSNPTVLPPNPEFRKTAITFLKKSAHEEKLGVNLELILKNHSDQLLTRLLELFRENLSDPGQIEELVDTGTLSLQQALTQEQSEVDIKMFGFVNVGNYHRIDVDINWSAGYLKKYIDIVPRQINVKAMQWGFVNVYTIDDITVAPNLHNALKIDFETAALERALNELGLLNLSDN